MKNPDMQQMLTDAQQRREEARKRFPLNALGESICPECGAVVATWFCETCAERRRLDEEIAQRRQSVNAHFHRCSRLDGEVLVPEMGWARFDNPLWRKLASNRIVNAVEAWNPDAGPLAIYAEDTGVGKTSSCVAWIARYRDRALQAAASSMPKLVSFAWVTGPGLRGAMRTHRLGTPDPAIFCAAKEAPLLFFDELGKEGLDPGLVLEITNARYGRPNFVTVMTTPLSRADFADRFGVAVQRRFIEGGTEVEIRKGERV